MCSLLVTCPCSTCKLRLGAETGTHQQWLQSHVAAAHAGHVAAAAVATAQWGGWPLPPPRPGGSAHQSRQSCRSRQAGSAPASSKLQGQESLLTHARHSVHVVVGTLMRARCHVRVLLHARHLVHAPTRNLSCALLWAKHGLDAANGLIFCIKGNQTLTEGKGKGKEGKGRPPSSQHEARQSAGV